MQRCPASSTSNAGFTLVEMALVIAIIGLIVGGITGGQYLVRQSQLQSVITDLNKYRSAWVQFKDQYKGPPGDILDATDYWGTDTATGCGTPVAADRVPKTATCNGNGDGQINLGNYEQFRAWQQMANAGLMDGAFTGVSGVNNPNYDTVGGQNAPAGKIQNLAYGIWYVGSQSGNAQWFDGTYPNVIIGGGYYTGFIPMTPIFTAREMLNLDLKIDDGKPATGIFVAHPSAFNNGCTTSDTAASSLYKATQSGNTCSLSYFLP